MVVLQNNVMSSISLAEVAGSPREIPLDHELLKTARKAGISLGDGSQ
jgi:PIN domain nuclease of toxin-antitoxin system